MTENHLDSYAQHAASQLGHVDQSQLSADVDLTIEQIITQDGAVVGHYHVVFGPERAWVHAGSAEAPDITIKQDAETARALRDGRLHAQGALLTGRLAVDGDVAKLTEYGPLLSGLLAAQPQD